jgi:dCMP deaminase
MSPRQRPTWNQYFMNIAEIIKTRSPDPSKQVGCVLVSGNDNRIISTGYNGLSANVSEFLFDWGDRDKIHQVIIHAEANCLLYSESRFPSYENLVLYSTLSPCIECLKLIRACGIRKIYYHEPYKNFEQVINIANLLEMQLIQINPTL